MKRWLVPCAIAVIIILGFLRHPDRFAPLIQMVEELAALVERPQHGPSHGTRLESEHVTDGDER